MDLALSPDPTRDEIFEVYGKMKDAFAAISLPLPMPKNEEEGRQFTDPETGITLSIITSFDFDERKWKTRVDMLIGFGRLHAETGSMRILCA